MTLLMRKLMLSGTLSSEVLDVTCAHGTEDESCVFEV